MAVENRKKFLGPMAGTIRDPTSDEQKHGRMVNPPRYPAITTGWKSRGVSRNDKKLSKPGDTV